MDHETFDVLGRWEVHRGPQQLAYDMWWHLGHDTIVTSEWGTPDMFENGLVPELLLAGKYCHKLHFWDLHRRKHLQEIDLGTQHQLNPAMGWLFAVALGLHRGRRYVVLQSLIPIALGHLLSIAVAAGAVLALGVIIDRRLLLMVAGGGLILWALYHLVYGSRHRARIGMQARFGGLLAWSFLMASAHGAGLMLAPALVPLCLSEVFAGGITAAGSLINPLAAVGIHTAAMVSVSGTIAILVYDWIGVGFLRRGWINLDWLWTGALAITGMILLVR